MKWSTGVLGVVIGIFVLALIEYQGNDAGAKLVQVDRPDATARTASHTADDVALMNQGLVALVATAESSVGGASLEGQTNTGPGAAAQFDTPTDRTGESRSFDSDGRVEPDTSGDAPAATCDRELQAILPVSPEVNGDNGGGLHTVTALATSILASLRTEHAEVVEDLANEEGLSYEDLLAMYGRSAATTGRFAHSTAAYALFLRDYGDRHEYSSEIALRLADSLAPLNVDSVEVIHTRDGPVYHPRWRMGYEPRQAQLRLALPAYELAAELAEDEPQAGRALLKRGWVCRALGEWETATVAWDHCAATCPGTEVAHQALRLAAENLAWTDQPAAAAERMGIIADTCTDAAGVQRALARVEGLESEAVRGGQDWLADPSAALEAEVKRRADVLPAAQVYRSVLRWLQRRGERAACVEVGIWACGQTDWPVSKRISAHYDLVESLLSGTPSPDDRRAAAKVLNGIVILSDDDATAVRVALRRCRLLAELGSFKEAEQALIAVEDRVAGSFEWEPRLLSARARMLLAEGDRAGATQVLADLRDSYPDYELAGELNEVLNGTPDEEE